MAIQVSSYIIPKNSNTFFVLEDKYLKGGLHVVQNTAERDAIDRLNIKGGMLVVTALDNKIWQLQSWPDEFNANPALRTPPATLTWTEFSASGGGGGGGGTGVRRTVSHDEANLQPQQQVTFSLALASTILVYSLHVSGPCIVEAFETAAMLDTNPYTFIATLDHMADDGTSLMSDGTVIKNRRYSILVNGDAVINDNIYFRLTSTRAVTQSLNLSLTYAPL